jgi:hypothetical protein
VEGEGPERQQQRLALGQFGRGGNEVDARRPLRRPGPDALGGSLENVLATAEHKGLPHGVVAGREMAGCSPDLR